ncbi:hypothetical protein C0991_007204, partial [Blastosporella zonata]
MNWKEVIDRKILTSKRRKRRNSLPTGSELEKIIPRNPKTNITRTKGDVNGEESLKKTCRGSKVPTLMPSMGILRQAQHDVSYPSSVKTCLSQNASFSMPQISPLVSPIPNGTTSSPADTLTLTLSLEQSGWLEVAEILSQMCKITTEALKASQSGSKTSTVGWEHGGLIKELLSLCLNTVQKNSIDTQNTSKDCSLTSPRYSTLKSSVMIEPSANVSEVGSNNGSTTLLCGRDSGRSLVSEAKMLDLSDHAEAKQTLPDQDKTGLMKRAVDTINRSG